MSERSVFFLSDQTGVTAETLGHSLLTQFEGQKFRQVTLPFIDSDDKAHEAVEKINTAAGKEGARPLVFSTLVQDEFRAVVRQSEGLYLDILTCSWSRWKKSCNKRHRIRPVVLTE